MKEREKEEEILNYNYLQKTIKTTVIFILPVPQCNSEQLFPIRIYLQLRLDAAEEDGKRLHTLHICLCLFATEPRKKIIKTSVFT